MMAKLFNAGQYFYWFLGDLVLRERDKIENECIAYRTGKSNTPPAFESLNDFYEHYSDHLPFKRTTMYEALRIRETIDPETLEAFGVAKSLEYIKINDRAMQKKAMKWHQKNPDCSVKQFQVYIDSLKEDLEEPKKVELAEKTSPIVPISIVHQPEPPKPAELKVIKSVIDDAKLDTNEKIERLSQAITPKIRENERILTFRDTRDADLFDQVFPKFEAKIKAEIEKLRARH
jgi:hypothetical protein